jgi:hypothetical protein
VRIKYMTMQAVGWTLEEFGYATAYRLFMPDAADSDWAYLHDRDSTPLEQAGLSAAEPMRPPPASDTAKGLDACRAKLCCSSPARERVYPER